MVLLGHDASSPTAAEPLLDLAQRQQGVCRGRVKPQNRPDQATRAALGTWTVPQPA
jgi:hypothetical protein